MEDCCDPAHLFAMTKMNSPMGKSLWYDGEFLYSFTIDNSTYSLFPQVSGTHCIVVQLLTFLPKGRLYGGLLTSWACCSSFSLFSS